MTPRTARRVLWLATFVALPVPIALFGPGRIPPAQLAELGALAAAVAVVESARGQVLPVAGVFFAQAAVWAALLWAFAWLLTRLLAPLGPRRLAAVVLAAVATGLAIACTLPVYDSPFAVREPRATLLGVYP